jgi:phosphonopyruvate decarboxylase
VPAAVTRATAPTAARILRALRDHGFTFATGVPCSLLAGLFTLLEAGYPDSPRYVPAPREDTAIGAACGAVVAGGRAVVLMQNSGLGYSLNVLTSLSLVYDIPVLLIVSWRGHDQADAIEHTVIGRTLTGLLDLFGIGWTLLDNRAPEQSVGTAADLMDRPGRCAALIVTEGI